MFSNIKRVDKFLFFALLPSIFIFWIRMLNSNADFNQQIYGDAGGYTPFATAHILTLFTFFVLSLISLFVIWIARNVLSPVLCLVSLSIMFIEFVINIIVILQVSFNSENYHGLLFYFAPLIYNIIVIVLTVRIINEVRSKAINRKYNNQTLNWLNNLIINTQYKPLFAIIFMLPLFLIVILILMIFGQDSHSITKVFTETTTWRFSQKTHPPLLDAGGHYLCTVAACGDPAIVKPTGLGYRNGTPIIINRQLQIANAFEELIAESIPSLHGIIRRFYDKYGYPLSEKITTPFKSNITYLLMKPLEYFFLLVLYSFTINPERRIAKQYRPKNKV